MSTPGPTIEAQIATLQQERIDGRIDQPAYLSRMQALHTAPPSAPAAPPSAQEAGAAIEELRAQRMAGTVSDRQFQERMKALGPVATPEMELSPDVQAALDKAMRPPASSMDYRFESGREEPTPESMQFDAHVRETFHTAQIPQAIAAPVFRAVETLAQRFGAADPATIATHQRAVGEQLRQAWGDRFQAKIDRLDAFLGQLKGPIAEKLRAQPWLLADVPMLTAVDAMLEYRAKQPRP